MQIKLISALFAALLVLAGCGANQDAEAEKGKDAKQQTATQKMNMPNEKLSENGLNVVKLKNGLTVLIKKDDRFPLANVRLYVRAGSAYEDPKQAGISHLLEHMVFKGTEKRGPGQTALEVESVGGSLNAATSFDYTYYYVEVPNKDWALGMDIVTDMAFNAKIDPAELKPEKEVVLAELKRGEDTPNSKLFKSIQGMLWKGTTYEWPIIGYRDVVKRLTSEDIHAYIDALYQPQSMLLTVVGDIDPAQVLAEAKRLTKNLENDHLVLPPEKHDINAPALGMQLKTIPGKWNKVYMGLAFPLPDLSSGKVAGLEMLGQLLGGDDTSLLYRKFKHEKRMVDDISVSAMTLERGGVLYVHATLDSGKTEAFWEELISTLASFDTKEFSDREIERARLNMEDSLFLTKETLSGLASKLAYFQFFEHGQEAEQNYLFSLSNTDREQLSSLYHEFVRPERLSACILYPEGSTLPEKELSQTASDIWPVENGDRVKTAASDNGGDKVLELPGGSRLVLLPDETLPYTAISIYWPGGDGIIGKDRQGMTSLVSRVLTRGTADMDATQIEDYLSDRAASIGAKSGRDAFAFEAKYPVRFSKDVLPLMAEMITRPQWPEKELDRAKQDQASAIKRREDQPLGLAFREMFPFLFTSGPYSFYHQGQETSFNEFSSQELHKYWKNQSSLPFVVAVSGQYDPEEIKGFADNLAKSLNTGGSYAFTAPQWSGEHARELELPGRNQAHLLAVFPTIGRKDTETSAAFTVLRAALAGQSGLLFRDMRDKQGLGYTVTAFLWQSPESGFMAFYIGTDPDKLDQAEQGFVKTIAMLRDGPLPDSEIQRAKNILNGEYYQDHQSLLSRSREAAGLMARGYDRNLEKKMLELADKVDAEQIRKLAGQYLDWDKAYIMTVKP